MKKELFKIAILIVIFMISILSGCVEEPSEEDTGTISIMTTPVEGDIHIDGDYVGTGSVSVEYITGYHTVSYGSVDEYKTPDAQTVAVNAGATAYVVGTYTSGEEEVYRRATETGTEAVQIVSSDIDIISIVGCRTSANTNNLQYVNITVGVMAGAEDIDIDKLVMAIQNKSQRISQITYATADIGLSSTSFTVTELRDDDNSFDSEGTDATIINSGDLITFNLMPPMDFGTRETMRIELRPEHGSLLVKELHCPATYGVDTYIMLFP